MPFEEGMINLKSVLNNSSDAKIMGRVLNVSSETSGGYLFGCKGWKKPSINIIFIWASWSCRVVSDNKIS